MTEYDPRWSIVVDGFDPDLEPTIEAVMALVNGYGGTRAAIEEGTAVSRPATFIGGVFNTSELPQAAELQEPLPEIVVAPDWSRIEILIDGAPLRLDTAELLDMRRVLDMQRGILTRTWRLRDAAGRITACETLRFAALDDAHTHGLQLRITPENYRATLTVAFVLDGAVTNANATRHLDIQRVDSVGQDRVLLVQSRTRQSGYTLAFAAATALVGAEPAMLRRDDLLDATSATARFSWHAERGVAVIFQRLVGIYTSRDTDDPAGRAVERVRWSRDMGDGFAMQLERHTRAWAARWAAADVQVGADDELQRQIRFAIYHLIGAANPEDERTSVGARALTGERYRGHIFWDTETFVWPFYCYTHPKTARALLRYRALNLGGARRKAQAVGCVGALYPWEATDTGEETTPPFVRSPSGELLKILTGVEEHHISADVAYAVVQYIQATGDDAFVIDHGCEMLAEIARFWASRAIAGDDGHFHILRVIGPDEYHDTIDDNAYTNQLARWCIEQATSALANLGRTNSWRYSELIRQIGLSDAELARWQRVAAGLVDGFDPATGLIEQFRGYFDLEEIDLHDHDTAVATLDVRLGWARLQELKALKQADVVMLLFLLWDEFAPAVRRANYDYYAPRTTHDSSLSPGMHALVAARLGDLAEAEDFLRRAARIDLDFTRKGWAGAAGGVHIAALGSIWQALAFGFLGLRPTDEGLRVDPQIPPSWNTVVVPFTWQKSQLRFHADASGPLRATLVAGRPVQVARGDGPWQLVRGEVTL